jgi:hypothetical protein
MAKACIDSIMGVCAKFDGLVWPNLPGIALTSPMQEGPRPAPLIFMTCAGIPSSDDEFLAVLNGQGLY